MNKEEFNKGISEYKKTSLTNLEKSAMLENIFKAPIVSPYSGVPSVFNFFQRPMATLSVVAVMAITGSSLAYAAEKSHPGESLYAIKTQVFEPILDQIHTAPLKKLEWEEEKIERRILEAESLADKNQLNEKKTLELERKIEKSSAAFTVAAGKLASSTATTTKGHSEEVEKLKKAFKDKLSEKSSVWIMVEDEKNNASDDQNDEKEARIQRLKESAIKGLEKKGNDKGRGNSKSEARD